MKVRRLVLTLIATAAIFVSTSATVQAYPGWWIAQANCIHRNESTDWHKKTDWRGYPSRDHGGYQIDIGTWQVFVPRSWPLDPADATPAQQTLVAWRIWLHNGRSWGNNQQWPNTARICGVR